MKGSKKKQYSFKGFLQWRKQLKDRILSLYIPDKRLDKELKDLQYILERTVKYGESDSVLITGFKGSGKTKVLNYILDRLENSKHEFLTIRLNGLIHTDDNLALREIISQLHLEELEGDKVSGSFSDNLLFVLQSLRTGDSKTCKPIVFILDEFHLFCSHRNQTLLYNLFEASQAAWAPICVVGKTTRVDVTELLEKRVKSRFSHRSILLLPNPSETDRVELFKSLLFLNSVQTERRDHFVEAWNYNISELCMKQKVQECLKKQLFYDTDERLFRSFLLVLISSINISSEQMNIAITQEDLCSCYSQWFCDAKVTLLQGLSTLELCLVIAMSHQTELYDEEPFNFEMILKRYLKFAKQSSSVKLSERTVILKAFERLQALELIIPVGGIAGRTGLKEYQMFSFVLTKTQVKSAIQSLCGLQTDILQWANSSLD